MSPPSSSPKGHPSTPPKKSSGSSGVTSRDPRLDFYRGIAMFIILLAHTPKNWWSSWIPARFGFSDATEIFVFCSGMASAIAFGGVFARHSWGMGFGRVIYRVWQVYWAHIGLFFFVAMTLFFLDTLELSQKSYIGSLNLFPFFKNTGENLVGLFTLTYVPNYFDILPMYLVILAMLPFVMLLSRVNVWLVFVVLGVFWFITNLGYLPLPAEPWSDRQWFFNPFGWQLVFFTGFALMIGWLPKPPISVWLFLVAALVVFLSMFIGSWKVINWVGLFDSDTKTLLLETRRSLRPFYTKTEFGIFRYVHFLALAYIGYFLAGDAGRRLIVTGSSFFENVWYWVVRLIMKVGQQSLAVFVFSMFLARIIGFVLDQLGRNIVTMTLANLTGFLLLILVAYLVGWFRREPWRSSVKV